MSALLQLLRHTTEARRLGLFALIAVMAVAAGFVVVTPATGKSLITAWGYYYMLGLFVLFSIYAWRIGRSRREVWLAALRRPGLAGLVIAAAAGFAIWSDPFKHKVLFDEYVLQATALHMHATKEIGTVIRAYEIAGSWVPIDTFLDKRPYLRPVCSRWCTGSAALSPMGAGRPCWRSGCSPRCRCSASRRPARAWSCTTW
jgi:hypothetical protein